MQTIYECSMVSGAPAIWNLLPGCEILTLKDRSRISEVRWRLDLDPNDKAMYRFGRAKMVREAGGGVGFVSDPASIRCAYRVVEQDGRSHIEGDVALWNEIEENVGYF